VDDESNDLYLLFRSAKAADLAAQVINFDNEEEDDEQYSSGSEKHKRTNDTSSPRDSKNSILPD
jgi:hypothetical protein